MMKLISIIVLLSCITFLFSHSTPYPRGHSSCPTRYELLPAECPKHPFQRLNKKLYQDKSTFVVATYNIRHGLGMDDVINVTRIANVLKEYKPVVVGVQEVDNYTHRNPYDQTLKLAKELNMNGFFAKAIDDFGGQYGVSLLSLPPFLKTEHRIFKTITYPGAENRTAQAAIVNVNTPIWVVNTHLDFCRNEYQYIQFLELLNFTQELIAKVNLPMIVFGDFNSEPNTRIIAKMKEYFTDLWDVCGVGNGYTILSNCPKARIDFIFVSKHIKIHSCEVVCNIASDHCALFASLSK